MTRSFFAIILTIGFFSAPAMAANSDNGIMQLLMGAIVTARPEAGNACGRSSECTVTESCVNGICQANNGAGTCTGDYQCPVGERCLNGVCRTAINLARSRVEPLGCISSGDCTPGESCVRGKCILNGGGPGSCLGDVDCPLGEHCRNSICGR